MPRVLIAAPPDLVAELDRSMLKRTGVERAETLIAYWLGEGAPPGEAAIAEDQKKGPRGQGE